MIGLRRKIRFGLWLCLALGLFLGLGSPIFSQSYGMHSHLLVADSDHDGTKESGPASAPDTCVYCHSWAGCALILAALPNKNLTERLLPPLRASVLPVAFLWRTDNPVYSSSHPRGPPILLLG